jgi:hypothetical protein
MQCKSSTIPESSINLSNYMTTTLDKSQNQLHEEFFFKSDLARLRFFFFYGRRNTELKHCTNEIFCGVLWLT